MEPQVRFCTASDGVRIAYGTMGRGAPLVFVPGWVSPLKYMAYEPRVAAVFHQLTASRQLILYDRRGTGMSDRDVTDFSREALVRDVEAVVDHLNLRRVVLLAWDQATPVTLEYAFRHPQKASHIILFAPFVRGRDFATPDTREGLVRLIRGGWGIGSEMISVLVMPGADPETARHYFTALRESCSAEAAAAQLEAQFAEDVTHMLPQIKTPTLILHARGDRNIPFELGREVASLMPNARLVALDSDVHFDLSLAAPMRQAVDEFLAPRKRRTKVPPERAAAGVSAPLTVLFTDMEGSTTLTQRLGDAKAQEVLRAHNAIVRSAVTGHGGSEIKHTGDGIMASFASASGALECAVAIQRAFAERNASLPAHPEPVEGRAEPEPSAHASTGSARADRQVSTAPVPIRVRIGLNAGEPVAEEADLFGAAVQLAARICAHAEPGRILAANVVRELAMGKGFLFADTGEVALKGFEDPVRLFEVRWDP